MTENEINLIEIVNSDEFLDLTKSAQALYFHLQLLIDEDLVVRDIKRRIREFDCSIEDLKSLVDGGFVNAGIGREFDINKIKSISFSRDMQFIRMIGNGRKNGI